MPSSSKRAASFRPPLPGRVGDASVATMPRSTDRYSLGAKNTPVMACKEQICRVMLQVANIRVDYRLSKLLHGWHEMHNGDKQNAMKQVAAGKQSRVHPTADGQPLIEHADHLVDIVSSLHNELPMLALNELDTKITDVAAVRLFTELFKRIFHSDDKKVLTLDFEKMTDG